MSTAEWGFGWLNIVPATGTRDQSSRNRMQRAYPTICLVSYTNRRKFEERRGRKRFGTNQGIGYSIASRVIKNYTRALTHGWGTKSIPSVVCSAIPPCNNRKAWLEQDSKKKFVLTMVPLFSSLVGQRMELVWKDVQMESMGFRCHSHPWDLPFLIHKLQVDHMPGKRRQEWALLYSK